MYIKIPNIPRPSKGIFGNSNVLKFLYPCNLKEVNADEVYSQHHKAFRLGSVVGCLHDTARRKSHPSLLFNSGSKLMHGGL